MQDDQGKTLLLLAGGAAALYFIADNANQAGHNPSVPPSTPAQPFTTTTAPNGTTTATVATNAGQTPLEQTQAQVNWIYNLLALYGYISSPLWYSPAGPPTELPVDPKGVNNLVASNQSATDNYQQFFWNVNKFFGWQYPAGSGNSSVVPGAALTGVATATPASDPTDWTNMQAQYAQIQTQFTAAWLSNPTGATAPAAGA